MYKQLILVTLISILTLVAHAATEKDDHCLDPKIHKRILFLGRNVEPIPFGKNHIHRTLAALFLYEKVAENPGYGRLTKRYDGAPISQGSYDYSLFDVASMPEAKPGTYILARVAYMTWADQSHPMAEFDVYDADTGENLGPKLVNKETVYDNYTGDLDSMDYHFFICE